MPKIGLDHEKTYLKKQMLSKKEKRVQQSKREHCY